MWPFMTGGGHEDPLDALRDPRASCRDSAQAAEQTQRALRDAQALPEPQIPGEKGIQGVFLPSLLAGSVCQHWQLLPWDLPAVSRQIPGQKFFLERGENQIKSKGLADGWLHSHPALLSSLSCSSQGDSRVSERWTEAPQGIWVPPG